MRLGLLPAVIVSLTTLMVMRIIMRGAVTLLSVLLIQIQLSLPMRATAARGLTALMLIMQHAPFLTMLAVIAVRQHRILVRVAMVPGEAAPAIDRCFLYRHRVAVQLVARLSAARRSLIWG